MSTPALSKSSTRSTSTYSTSTDSNSGTHSATSSDRTIQIPLNFSNLGLVGRTTESKVLVDAHDRISNSNAAELVWVSGASGTGKSTLVVEALEQLVSRRGGFFGMGKFEQSSQPCSALGAALTELCYGIQSSPNCLEIQNDIQALLEEEDMHVLATFVPGIRLLLNIQDETSLRETKQSDTSDKNDVAAERMRWALFRLLGVLKSFLRAVCKTARVVLFLDDVQQADALSLRIMASLLTDDSSTSKHNSLNNLLLIGAFRDDEGSELEQDWLMDIKNNKVPVSTVELGPLSEQSVNEIVAKATEMRNTNHTTELSKIVHQKTQGNALFVIQYLEMIHQQGWLRFSFGTNRWEWDLAAIQQNTDVCENVVQVLLAKVSALPQNVQEILMIAACLGFTFDRHALEELVVSHDWSEYLTPIKPSQTEEFGTLLEQAIQTGLIETCSSSSNKFKFSHDRIQQTAIAMIPDGPPGAAFRYHLGEIILQMSQGLNENAQQTNDWMLFTSVDLLTKNRGEHMVLERALELARLSLVASRKAAKKSAFVSAANFADRGLSLLTSNHTSSSSWEDHYDLCLELVTLSAEMHYSYGNFEKSKECISVILKRSRCLQDKLRAYRLSLAIHGGSTDLQGATMEGIDVLKQLGVSVPRNPNGFHVIKAVSKTKRLLRDGGEEDLRDLPPMTNLVMSEAMQVLGRLIVFDWRLDQKKMLAVHASTMIQITLQHGFCSYSPYAAAVWGATLSHFGDLEQAYKYGVLAEDMLQRDDMGDTFGYAETVKAIHLLFAHIKRPLHKSIEPVLNGYHVARRIGDPQMASCCIKAHALISFFVGMTLENLEKQLQGYCDFCREFRQEPSLLELLPWQQLVLNLMGKSENPLILSGRGMVEKEFIEKLSYSSDRFLGTVMLGSARLILFYVFEELDEAELERRKYNPMNDFVGSYFTKYINFFFCGLICLGQARKKNKWHYLRLCRRYSKEMEKYAKSGSVNSVPMIKLLRAEENSVRNPSTDCSKQYNEAISMAGRCGFRFIKAIACERAGASVLAQGDTIRAGDYLKQAWQEFAAYGAYAKLSQMEKKYSSVVSFEDLASAKNCVPSRLLQPHLVEDQIWKQEV